MRHPSPSRNPKERKLGKKARQAAPGPSWGEQITEWGLLAVVVLLALLVYVGTQNPSSLKRLTLVLIVLSLSALLVIRLALGERICWPRSPTHLPLLLFLAAGGLSALFSSHRYLAAGALSRLLLFALLYLLVITTFRRPAQLTRLLKTLFVTALLVGLVGLFQRLHLDLVTTYFRWFHGLPWKWEEDPANRIFSTFNNAAYLASFLLVLLPLFINLALAPVSPEDSPESQADRKPPPKLPRPASPRRAASEPTRWRGARRRLVFGGLSLLMLLCLLLAVSRASWGAALIALALDGLLLWRLAQRRLFTRRLALAAIGLAAVLFLGTRLVSPAERRRVAETFAKRATSDVMYLEYWKSAFGVFRQHPLLGVGPGNFDVAGLATVSQTWYAQQRRELGLVLNRAHNIYLDMLSEFGLIGLVLFLWFLGSYFWSALAAIKRAASLYHGYLLAGLTAGVAGFLLHGLFAVSFHNEGPATYFWLALGLTTAVAGLSGETRELRLRLGREAKAALVLGAIGAAVLPMGLSLRHFGSEVLLRSADSLQRRFQSGDVLPEERQALWSRMLEDLQQAEELDPYSLPVHYRLGFLYGQMREHARARDEFRQAVALNPNFPDLHRNLGVSHENLASQERRPEEKVRLWQMAEREYREMLRLGDSAEAYYLLANLLLQRSKLEQGKARAEELQRAREDIHKALTLRSDLARYHLTRAAILEQAQAPQWERRQALEGARSALPEDPGIAFKLGSLEAEAGNWEKAVPLIQEAAGRVPNSSEYQLALGKAYVSTEHWPEACQTLELVLSLEKAPSPLAEANYYLARAWKARGEKEKAREAALAARRLDPSFRPAEVERLIGEQ